MFDQFTRRRVVIDALKITDKDANFRCISSIQMGSFWGQQSRIDVSSSGRQTRDKQNILIDDNDNLIADLFYSAS
jgi:hypothetical protein